MEAMLSERIRLQGLGPAASAEELKEVEEQIECLDAQIDFDTECITKSQTHILRLTAVAPDRVETTLASVPGIEGQASTSGSAVVDQLSSLDEARSACLVCFRSIDELQSENSQLQARVLE